jgi:regulator of protease activity HflC (stomatin/prohibitin superfamily)
MNTETIVIIVFALILLIVLRMFIPFLFAKYKAVNQKQAEIDLLCGWVKLVLWQPNEGVVILRNKNVIFTDEQGKGGIKYILPIKGDELRAKVLLTTRLLTWEDDKILTRESLRIHMKVAVWWNVSDIIKYVFDIDRPAQFNETRSESNLLKSSEAWLRTLTEGTIRVLASKASATQLITTATTGYLNVHHNSDGNLVDNAPSVQTISETIALQLGEDLNRKLKSFGMSINRVEIQAIRLSAEVQQAIDKVWLSFLKPVQTEQEARARQIELEAAARVLGADSVALIELFKNFPESKGALFQPPFLQPAIVQPIVGILDAKIQKMQSPNWPTSLSAGKGKNMIEDK